MLVGIQAPAYLLSSHQSHPLPLTPRRLQPPRFLGGAGPAARALHLPRVRPNGGAFSFHRLGLIRSPFPPNPTPPPPPIINCKEKIPGHFHFLCGSRALLFNPVATTAASFARSLHPSTWPIPRRSCFSRGELGVGGGGGGGEGAYGSRALAFGNPRLSDPHCVRAGKRTGVYREQLVSAAKGGPTDTGGEGKWVALRREPGLLRPVASIALGGVLEPEEASALSLSTPKKWGRGGLHSLKGDSAPGKERDSFINPHPTPL